MEHIFWLIPDKLAGRPGPDRKPWDVSSINAAGFAAVLSVNDGCCCSPEEFAGYGIDHACIPLPSSEPPEPGDEDICITALPKAYAFVAAHLNENRRVLVHCSGGKDRTGLFLSYFLMRNEQISPAEAIARVRAVRPIALSALGWAELAQRVLEHLSSATQI